MQPGDQRVEPEAVQQRPDETVQNGQRRSAAARRDHEPALGDAMQDRRGHRVRTHQTADAASRLDSADR